MIDPSIAIVDYGLGNLFSINQACSWVGLKPVITDDPAIIDASSAMILPGVGAFGTAMESLKAKNLVPSLLDFARSGRPMLAICLGMQLFMDRSFEFGVHEGLGLISGEVRPLPQEDNEGEQIRVPQVGWREVNSVNSATSSWDGTILHGLSSGVQMYFVHSFCVQPDNDLPILSVTNYNSFRFCSAIRRGNLWGLQFHPERSGSSGLRVYENFARLVRQGDFS